MTRLSPRRLVPPMLAVVFMLAGCGAVQDNTRPMCRYGPPTLLMAESVPTAELVPCVRVLPPGWHFGGFDVKNDRARFWLDSDLAGDSALTVELTEGCSLPAGVDPVETDEEGTTMHVGAESSDPAAAELWMYRFDGGCATYRVALGQARVPLLERQVADGVSFIRWSALDREHEERTGRSLDPE